MIPLSPQLSLLDKKLIFNFPVLLKSNEIHTPIFAEVAEKYVSLMDEIGHKNLMRMLWIKKCNYLMELFNKFPPGEKMLIKTEDFPGKSLDVWGKSLRYQIPNCKDEEKDILAFIFNLGFNHSLSTIKKNKKILTVFKGDLYQYKDISILEINDFFNKSSSHS